MGRGEKENPELAGLVELELEPKENEGALVAGVLVDVDAGVAAGLPKLNVGRADGVVLEAADGAAVEGAALADAPLVAGLNGAAVLLKLLALLADGGDVLLSRLSRCLRYWSRNDSMRPTRSAKGSASSCSLIF